MSESECLEEAIRQFRGLKKLTEKALAQVGPDDFFAGPGGQSNSIAVIVKHLAGNLKSRWTDFLMSDGEKPDRDRDSEFEIRSGDSRESLERRWETGWSLLFEALEPLTPKDLGRTVPIRGEPHPVLKAIHRQLVHYAYHVGQIVLLAKHFAGEDWKSLSIPRKKT